MKFNINTCLSSAVYQYEQKFKDCLWKHDILLMFYKSAMINSKISTHGEEFYRVCGGLYVRDCFTKSPDYPCRDAALEHAMLMMVKISQNPAKMLHHQWNYYCQITGKRWPEIEPILMQNPLSARMYAVNVIRGRWPEAEPRIKSDADQWKTYCLWLNVPAEER